MHTLIKSMKALSDETRLRILNILLERECCVCEVMQALDISQSRASRNLGILEDAGFLTSRRDGLWTFYAIDKGQTKNRLPDLITAIARALAANRLAIKDRQRLKKAVRVGPGCAAKVQRQVLP